MAWASARTGLLILLRIGFVLTLLALKGYPPIRYRWAANCRNYHAPEPKRFVGYWDSMAGESALALTGGSATVR